MFPRRGIPGGCGIGVIVLGQPEGAAKLESLEERGVGLQRLKSTQNIQQRTTQPRSMPAAALWNLTCRIELPILNKPGISHLAFHSKQYHWLVDSKSSQPTEESRSYRSCPDDRFDSGWNGPHTTPPGGSTRGWRWPIIYEGMTDVRLDELVSSWLSTSALQITVCEAICRANGWVIIHVMQHPLPDYLTAERPWK